MKLLRRNNNRISLFFSFAFDVPIKTHFTVSQIYCQLIVYYIIISTKSHHCSSASSSHLADCQIHYFRHSVLFILFSSPHLQDIEGLASKILESMYGTTIKFSSRGQRTVKVTLNVRQSTAVQGGTGTMPSWSHQLQGSRERKNKPSSADKADQQQHNKTTNATESPAANDADCPVYGVKGSPHHKVKPGAQRYRRDQLVEMVQRSLAENLSFQNQRYLYTCDLLNCVFHLSRMT